MSIPEITPDSGFSLDRDQTVTRHRVGRGCDAAQAAAVSRVPSSRTRTTGGFRAFSTTDGALLWEYDTNRDFETVNGIPGVRASILGPGPAIAGGMVFVNSGYGSRGGRRGNVPLAFGLE